METYAEAARVELSEESKRVLADWLKTFDKSGDGAVNRDELGKYLKAYELNLTDDTVDFICEHFDKNSDGRLQIAELVDNLHMLPLHAKDSDCVDELRQAFQKFDQNGDGFIRMPELKKILTCPTGKQMNYREAEVLLTDLLKNFDKDKNGKFDYPEFVNMFMEDAFKKPTVEKVPVTDNFEQVKTETEK